jgi:hypothetical protein
MLTVEDPTVTNRSIGPTIKIILSVQDNFCRTFATVRRTFRMTVPMDTNCAPLLVNLFIYSYEAVFNNDQ